MLRQTVLLIGLLALLGAVMAGRSRPHGRKRCWTGDQDCDSNAMCVSTSRGKPVFYCQCKPGYRGNGYSCADIDECATHTDNCHCHASCSNTAGGFSCACDAGYTGSGVSCTDINECALGSDNCHANATCNNTVGGFTCACDAGFTGNGTSCTPMEVGNSCKDTLEKMPGSPDGVYTIRLEQATEDTQVYCDMTTAPGGWTLVYSYTFTNYDDFGNNSNAVTPAAGFPYHNSQVSVSTTTPLGLWDTHIGAMNFQDWRKIGSEMLFRSNITNWYHCLPMPASIVNANSGDINCTIAKVQPQVTCTPQSVPDRISLSSEGFKLLSMGELLLRLEVQLTTSHVPNHYPCSSVDLSHIKNVASPGGAVFIR